MENTLLKELQNLTCYLGKDNNQKQYWSLLSVSKILNDYNVHNTDKLEDDTKQYLINTFGDDSLVKIDRIIFDNFS